MRTRLGRIFQSLKVRNYRLFATGQLIKLTGVWMQFTAQYWLVLQLSDDSGTALGLVVALQFLPVLFLSLYGGKLADRHDKRKLLILVNAAWSVLSLAFALMIMSGVVRLWHVFVFAGLLGVANAIENPARQAFVSEMVDTRLLPNALALSAATFNSARIVGPAVAGVAIAWFGTGPVFLVSAISSISPVLSLVRMRVTELHREDLPPAAAREASIRDGLRYVWRRSDLVMVMTMIAVVGALGFNFGITLPILAKTTYQTGAEAFGLLTTLLALGSLAGALASTGRRERPSAYVVIGSALVFGALAVAVGLASSFWLASLLLVPTGFFMVFFAQSANQRVQLGADAAYRGRVMALYVLVFLGSTPVGGPLIGWLAEVAGAPASIWLGGLVSLVTAVIALALQLRSSGDRLRVRMRPRPRLYVSVAEESIAASPARVG
ncbi:MAG: MFS transporter [Micromonosporaceae bacterium]